MQKPVVAAWLGCVLAVLFGAGALADDEVLPTVRTLSCVGNCANAVEAEHINKPLPNYPMSDTGWVGAYVEGYVRLHYTITSEGKVGDIVILDLVGPQEFAANTEQAVRNWTFKPATVNDKPVATCRTLLMTFKVSNVDRGARPEIVSAYQHALRAVDDKKWDDALGLIIAAQTRPKLNFYERGMLANMGAQILLQKHEYLEARRMAELATDHGAEELSPAVVRALWQTRIAASLALGDMVDALESFDRLKAVSGFENTTPIVKMVEDVQSKIDALPEFPMVGKIPEGDGAEGFYVGLYRRNFGFQDIKGSLEKFTLNCHQQAVESTITDKAEWHIPKSWSDCRLLVRGTPGTTFRIVEANGS